MRIGVEILRRSTGGRENAHDFGSVLRVGYLGGHDGVAPRSAAESRPSETDEAGQCRRGAGVDPGRPGYWPGAGWRVLFGALVRGRSARQLIDLA